jgi:uncharacterized iron-regulated protein
MNFKTLRKILVLLFLFALLLNSSTQAAKISKAEFDRLRLTEKILRSHIGEMESEFQSSNALAKYKKEYLVSIATRKPEPINDNEMIERINNARFVFLGDEHTTNASQKATLFVLKIMLKKCDAPVTLVLEWIDESQQSKVDQFLEGKISLSALRKKIDFDKDWGFSWKNYSAVLAAAKRYKLQILLVERLKKRHSLKNRDTYISAKLAENANKNPSSRYLVIYGEYHLSGPNHLPHKCSKLGLKSQIILVGEAPEIYWKLLGQTKDPNQIGFAHLKKNLYYINSGTPLERSFSYRAYLMNILDYEADDFGDYIAKGDILPKAAAASNFDRLHQPCNK